ncbi:MAG: DUF4411 family protein [Candidatus Acidiferrales bacterium]
MPYSLDTSGILDAWVRHYPPDVFPALWSFMSEASKNQEIFVIDEVVAELERKDDDVHKWVKQREAMIVAIDEQIQSCLAKLMSKYPRLVDSKKNRSGGDPWVIALAQARSWTVVTAEKPSGNLTKPKIPDVCKDLSIPCIEVVEFFRRQGWKW